MNVSIVTGKRKIIIRYYNKHNVNSSLVVKTGSSETKTKAKTSSVKTKTKTKTK